MKGASTAGATSRQLRNAGCLPFRTTSKYGRHEGGAALLAHLADLEAGGGGLMRLFTPPAVLPSASSCVRILNLGARPRPVCSEVSGHKAVPRDNLTMFVFLFCYLLSVPCSHLASWCTNHYHHYLVVGTYLLTLDISPLISDHSFYCDSFNHPWPHGAPRDASYIITQTRARTHQQVQSEPASTSHCSSYTTDRPEHPFLILTL